MWDSNSIYWIKVNVEYLFSGSSKKKKKIINITIAAPYLENYGNFDEWNEYKRNPRKQFK